MTITNNCCANCGRIYPEREIFFIGGSPCSGKSSIAEKLAAEFGFYYHKEDDFLEAHMAQAVANGCPITSARMQLSWADAWMRDPKLQSVEEIVIYQELFPYVLAELAAIPGEQPVITEAAAFMPELMYNLGVHPSRYICIVPSEDFQRREYAKREWIGMFLSECDDPDHAFSNWMSRDALFAVAMEEQAGKCGYESILVDGSASLEHTYQLVKRHFLLSKNS